MQATIENHSKTVQIHRQVRAFSVPIGQSAGFLTRMPIFDRCQRQRKSAVLWNLNLFLIHG